MSAFSIPKKLKWPLVALWISLGLHGALIAWVRIAPQLAVSSAGSIEARLMPAGKQLEALQIAQTRETSETLKEVVAESEAFKTAITPPSQPTSSSDVTSRPPDPTMPHIEIPLAVDLTYYSTRELDQIPVGKIPDPPLPAALSGKIQFQVKIEESGRVSDVKILSSDPPEAFDQATLEMASKALQATQFKPGFKNGRPVRALVIYELMVNP